MTLVAIYRYGPFAIILNDFRITHDKKSIGRGIKQVDACMKFATISARMGMFFAGDVEYIQRLLPVIREIEPNLTLENIIQPDGLLQQRLLDYSKKMSSNFERVIEAIGFLFDETTNRNEIFLIKGVAGKNIMKISKVPSGVCTVIGSGGKIPSITETLTRIGRNGSSFRKLPNSRKRYKTQFKYDQFTVAGLLQTSLNNMLEQCGSSVYLSLGVSPYFAQSLIGPSGFVMQGITTKRRIYTTDFTGNTPVPPKIVEYSLERDTVTGIIKLTDQNDGKSIVVNEIENYSEGKDDEILSIQKFSNFDPSEYTTTGETLYFMNQWVDEHFIDRKIEKCNTLDGFINPNYILLATDIQEPVPNEQLVRYQRSGKYFLNVPLVLANDFENSVKNHVFDHIWLQQYVQNYADFYV